MKDHPLLPFSYSSQPDATNALDTTPRDRQTIDQNAASIYHTRRSVIQDATHLETAPIVDQSYKQNVDQSSNLLQNQNEYRFLNQLPNSQPGSQSQSQSQSQTSFGSQNLRRTLRPTLSVDPPSLKRKMGTLFNENDDIKRRDYEFLTFSSDDDKIALPNRSTEPAPKAFSQLDSQSQPQSIESLMHSQFRSFHQDDLRNEPRDTKPNVNQLDVDLNSHDPALANESANIPSSPPPILPSELDIHTQTSFVPESPSKNNDMTRKLVSPRHRKIKIPSSEPDFGIDLFNRFRNNNGAYLSTDDNINDIIEREDKEITARARQIILNAFDNAETTINLEGMGLKEVPEEIKDLNDLVVFDLGPSSGSSSHSSSLQLYLTKNKLRSLPPALFAFTKLNVLGLRHNKIQEIPELISTLINLTDLYLGTNRLKYLPASVLDLPKLRILLTGPNPFMEVSGNAEILVSDHIDDQDKSKTLVAFSKLEEVPENRIVPTLRAFALDKIAKYDVSYSETRHWKKYVPKLFHPTIAKAIRQGKYNEKCSECNLIVVDTYIDAFEWWDILGNKAIPFKKQFCSGGCYGKWKAKMEDNINFQEDK